MSPEEAAIGHVQGLSSTELGLKAWLPGAALNLSFLV